MFSNKNFGLELLSFLNNNNKNKNRHKFKFASEVIQAKVTAPPAQKSRESIENGRPRI